MKHLNLLGQAKPFLEKNYSLFVIKELLSSLYLINPHEEICVTSIAMTLIIF